MTQDKNAGQGGRYIVDPKTGERTKVVEETAPPLAAPNVEVNDAEEVTDE
jgi:hypothetical protein